MIGAAMAAMRISVVTPSLNQSAFVDHTLRSVLDQGYENLEYVVVDGGSTDGSREIIERHADRLAWWTSEPDGGHAAALNKGFARTTGEIMAWLNSDDTYLPWTFQVVAEVFSAFPQVNWIAGTGSSWDRHGRLIGTTAYRKNIHDYLLNDFAWIQQESVFWRRDLWDRAGGAINEDYDLAVDGELWSRFFLHDRLYHLDCVIGGFRHHDSNRGKLQFARYVGEIRRATAGMRTRAPAETLATTRKLRTLRALYRRAPGDRIRRQIALRSRRLLEAAGHDVIRGNGSGWQCRREPFRL
ncbi:MAG: glycosyltransferase family 2 protein [Longimicrobiales bacterium]